jgi:hypothetical protein
MEILYLVLVTPNLVGFKMQFMEIFSSSHKNSLQLAVVSHLVCISMANFAYFFEKVSGDIFVLVWY